MLFLLPFLILLLVLYITKSKMVAVLSALLSSFFVYSYLSTVSIWCFISDILPLLCFEILSPSGYLYPLLFLLLVASIINIFKDLEILDSYSVLLNYILQKGGNNRLFDFSILLSPFLFFIDDYLIMFGVKSFFSPLIGNSENNKKELAFYTINIAAGGSVLLFFSTWSGIIINQLEIVQKSIAAWKDIPAISIFLASKKYFIYPIVTYLGLCFYTYSKKKNLLVGQNTVTINKNILWIDIFIFLLLPLSIAFNFIYRLYYLLTPLVQLDVAYTMLEGVFFGGLIIFFLLILHKSVSYKYFVNSFAETLVEYQNTIISLVACWLFSKITLLSLQLSFSFVVPVYLSCLYPVFYFLLSMLISFVLGSEWGTLSITIPLLVCVKDYHNLLLILGAIVSGVVAGAQLSPVSNTAETVSAIFEVDSLDSYLYRIRYSLIFVFISTILYFMLGFFL
jgi:hypothetical protein